MSPVAVVDSILPVPSYIRFLQEKLNLMSLGSSTYLVSLEPPCCCNSTLFVRAPHATSFQGTTSQDALTFKK